MKHLKLFIVLLLVFSVAVNAQSKLKKSSSKKTTTEEVVPPPPPPPPTDGLFIHISSGLENPQKVLMALTMALKMADDHDVYVYLDINGINVVLNNAKSIEMPKFEPSKIEPYFYKNSIKTFAYKLISYRFIIIFSVCRKT